MAWPEPRTDEDAREADRQTAGGSAGTPGRGPSRPGGTGPSPSGGGPGRPWPEPPGRWWRPLRQDDPRDGWRPATRVWLTFCPRHGVRADTKRRWEVCPVCHGPMGVDARRDAAPSAVAAGEDGRAGHRDRRR
jgi:hypothetical protein